MRRVVTSRGEDDRLGQRFDQQSDCSKSEQMIVEFPSQAVFAIFSLSGCPRESSIREGSSCGWKSGILRYTCEYLGILGNTWEYLGNLVKELLSSTSVSATVSILFLFQKDNLWMKDEEEVEEERLRRWEWKKSISVSNNHSTWVTQRFREDHQWKNEPPAGKTQERKVNIARWSSVNWLLLKSEQRDVISKVSFARLHSVIVEEEEEERRRSLQQQMKHLSGKI